MVQNKIYKTEPRYSIVELGIVQGFSPYLLKLITNLVKAEEVKI